MAEQAIFADTVNRLIQRYHAAPCFDDWVNGEAKALNALPVGWDLWSHWFLRPNGAVVITDGDETVICSDRIRVLQALVGGAKYYPELSALLPERETGATDCPCPLVAMFRSKEIICPECGGVGWLPAK